jgi:hypothetical protein
MNMRGGRCWVGLMLAGALAGFLAGPAQAVQASFTVNGTVTTSQPALGFGAGTAVSYTWVLDETAILQARYEGPASGPGTMSWFQDLFSSAPQLWKSIGGSGLTGVWQPPANGDSGVITLSAANYPQPYPATFQMRSDVYYGAVTGLQLNGRDVTGLQMNAVYKGLDALAIVGPSGLPPADPTTLFVSLAGTYPADPNYVPTGSIWTSAGSGGYQFLFQIDSLTVAAVPEPGAWLMLLAGGFGVLGISRRRLRPQRLSGHNG